MRSAVAPQRGWVVGGVAAGVVWTAAKLTIPLLAATAIDDGMRAGDQDKVIRLTVVMVLVGIVQAVCTGLRRYSAFRIALRTETDLRQRLFTHLQRLHFAFHDQAQTGQLMARANTDIQQVQTVVILIPLTVAAMFTMGGVLAIMLWKNAILAVLALGALPFLNLAATRFSHRIAPVNLALQEELADVSGVVEESLSGIRVVKGFGAERQQIRRLEQEADSVLDRSLAAARLRAGFMPLVDFLPTISMVAILWYGGHQVLAGNLQVGDILAFNLYILMLIWPMRMMGMLVAQASRASAGAGRVQEILATDPAIADAQHAVALPDGPGALRFEGVSFGYGRGRLVLDGLDLEIHGGAAVAIVGATGSGKSTVARLVPRFYDVDAGRILLDGVDVRDVAVDELRGAVGIVFEDTFLFSDTVRENIAFADPDASMEVVERAARLAGAADFIGALPRGYDTVIGEHGFSLSGGQRQRIAIARAVLADPRILILDDATSSVDPTKEHEIRSALGEVMTGRTTLIIAHRPATIALADRVVLIGDGRVVATGTHEELLRTSAEYRTVLASAALTAAEPLAPRSEAAP
ncbi:MAG: ABC transporter ATP-binding protein [Acidimicrobiia bacterium]